MKKKVHKRPYKQPTTSAGRKAAPKCGATTRAGTPCGRPAGFGTDHPGEGKCKLHGGIGQTPAQEIPAPQMEAAIRPYYEAEKSREILDLEELARKAKATAMWFLDHQMELVRQLEDWHRAWSSSELTEALEEWAAKAQLALLRGEPVESLAPPPTPETLVPRPRRIPNLALAVNTASEMLKLAERLQRIERTSAIPVDAAHDLMSRAGEALHTALRSVLRDDNEIERAVSVFEGAFDALLAGELADEGSSGSAGRSHSA